jgi:hypothetical protein
MVGWVAPIPMIQYSPGVFLVVAILSVQFFVKRGGAAEAGRAVRWLRRRTRSARPAGGPPSRHRPER